jgi:general secretion pathway protein D
VDSLTYHAFLEVLGVHGFVAVPSGDVVAIIPEAQMSQVASPIVRVDDIRGDDAEVVTVIIPVGEGASAKDLAALMRDLIPRSGYIGPTADNKGLMLVARVANVKRIAALVRAQAPQP